jgi:diketogulonate reductase-like aldo/keto reductase
VIETILSRYDVAVPRILYGTAWKEKQTAALVEQALDCGFRGIDTACQPKHYDEAGVGDGIAAQKQRGLVARADLYLQSKFTPIGGQDPRRIPYDSHSSLGRQIEQSMRVSLRNLKTTTLDCLILHSPMATHAQTMVAWKAMEQLVSDGHVRQLGLSNCYDPQQFEALVRDAHHKPAVLQNRFHAATGYDRAIRRICQQHHILYQGFWILSANRNVLHRPVMRDLAVAYRCSPEVILLRYTSQMGMIPLTGTTSLAHMQDDLAMFNFTLTPVELAAVDALLG